MARVSEWNPETVDRLVDELLAERVSLQAELAAVRAERDTFRDAWRAEIAKVERLREGSLA